MPRSLSLGNGNLLICIDKNGYVRDFYYPYVGLENHVGDECFHKVGVWVEGKFSWLEDKDWEIKIGMETDTLIGSIEAENKNLEVKIHFRDFVYNEKNIFVRKITINNLSSRKRLIKLFLNQQFQIYGSPFGDTAYFDPINRVIIHYKIRRVFLVNVRDDKQGFDAYSVGAYASKGREGTYKDAEDGELCGNSIEHGFVDSVIGIYREIEAGKSETFHYWIIAAKTIAEALELNDYTIRRTAEHFSRSTEDFWKAWVNKENFNFDNLDSSIIDLFKKSLLIMRTHIDNTGAIIASGDSDMMSHGRDTYGYMWPRDAAFTVIALDKAGYSDTSRRFFEFANDIISKEGYFLHKYCSDKSLGSSWHSWIRDGNISLPIQEDETALIIYALWKHYEKSRDLDFIERIYNSLIKKAADFMLFYRDKKTGLPYPTYDLWEEKYGVSAFASSAVYAAFIAAGKFAKLLGKKESEVEYNHVASEVREAIIKYLFNSKEGLFYKMISQTGSVAFQDNTIDASSVYGVFKFGVLNCDDKKMVDSIQKTEAKLLCKTPVGGIARYEGDMYHKNYQEVPGNPWIITSLWFAQYYIAKAKNVKDLDKVREWLIWVCDKALLSGVLPEQVDPYNKKHLSAAPLTWSHTEFVVTVIEYLEKLAEFGEGKVYKPIL